jgi:hypothetical protein
MHYTVKASDPGGSFTLQIDRGRAVHATVDGAAVAPGRIQQRSDSIFIYNPRGKRELALRVDPRGGISWYPRSQ